MIGFSFISINIGPRQCITNFLILVFLIIFFKKQEHLLKMATEHRAEMAVKRGKAARLEGL